MFASVADFSRRVLLGGTLVTDCGCQVEVRVDRDPQRLLRPTEGWKERQKDAGPSSNGPVLHMPHR